MAVTNFVPAIWSATILTNLSKNLVAQAITNQDYEGDASGGSVKITSISDPTIGDYTPHSDITVEALNDATRTLNLDQKKYFAFEIDDVEKAQSVNGGTLMSEASLRSAHGLGKVIDAYTLAAMAADASAAGPDHQVAEKTINTAAGAYDELVAWSVMLDEADVPEIDRWAVVTPAFHGLVLKDPRFVSAGDAAAATTRGNGLVGTAAGFTLHKSTNLANGPGAGAGKAMLAGFKGATTLAVQLDEVKAFSMEKRFADAVKGLTVFGAKVTRPTGLVAADIIVA